MGGEPFLLGFTWGRDKDQGMGALAEGLEAILLPTGNLRYRPQGPPKHGGPYANR
jgi:hypothetical protein